jgi:hypothetical protein
MTLSGGCYCGAVRYEGEGPIRLRGQCYCRECQFMSGGAENLFLVLPSAGFRVTRGEPATFRRPDLPQGVTRSFCGVCGCQLFTRTQDPSIVVVKVGTLDDPRVFEAPELVCWTGEKQPFHHLPPGVDASAGRPVRKG